MRRGAGMSLTMAAAATTTWSSNLLCVPMTVRSFRIYPSSSLHCPSVTQQALSRNSKDIGTRHNSLRTYTLATASHEQGAAADSIKSEEEEEEDDTDEDDSEEEDTDEDDNAIREKIKQEEDDDDSKIDLGRPRGSWKSKFPRLGGKERKDLRAYAHNLALPKQHIGKSGVTAAVINALSVLLESKELIKLKVLDNCNCELQVVMEKLEDKLEAQIVGQVGRSLLVYRPSLRKIEKEEEQQEQEKKKAAFLRNRNRSNNRSYQQR